LAESLGISRQAVHRHLVKLEDKGRVSHIEQSRDSSGRPANIWFLADGSDAIKIMQPTPLPLKEVD
jgi:predicted ArsR family transcriptional regulator